MPMLTPLAAARNESFCAISSPPSSARCTGNDLPGIGRAEGDSLFCPLPVEEYRHEQRLARQQPFAGAHQRAHEAALLLRAVAEDRLHLDAVVHVHHAARFGDGGFVRIQLDFDELHVVAENLVVDLVHRRHRECLCQRGGTRGDGASGADPRINVAELGGGSRHAPR